MGLMFEIHVLYSPSWLLSATYAQCSAQCKVLSRNNFFANSRQIWFFNQRENKRVLMSLRDTVVRGQGRQKNNSKNKNRIFEIIFYSILIFLYSEKENFEEYSLNLEFAKFSFPILNNYLVEKRRPCPRAIVMELSEKYIQERKLRANLLKTKITTS
jgi:hypothetical protein